MTQKSNHFELPRYIGICGNPTAGKSTIAEIMVENYGATLVDDGGPLREIAIKYFGLTYDQVYTQAGKLETVNILGRDWIVREFLGELGNRFENLVGEFAMPYMVCHALEGAGPFVFGSVRKTQGHFYKQQGGLIIGVRRPGVGPSAYAFDRFDETAVDIWINNDGLERGMPPHEARLHLAAKIHDAVVNRVSWAA